MGSKKVADVKILLVDDEPIIADIYGTFLREGGYHVTTAMDGVEAWTLLQERSYDLIILDIDMPHLNGWEVVDKLRENLTATISPILFFTSFDNAAYREKARRVGIRSYITKPCEPQILLSEVAMALAEGTMTSSVIQ